MPFILNLQGQEAPAGNAGGRSADVGPDSVSVSSVSPALCVSGWSLYLC